MSRQKWTEPILVSIIGPPEFEWELTAGWVGGAVKNRTLSGRLLTNLLHMLTQQDDHSFHKEVDLGDGVKETLLTLLVLFAEQSYELACSTFDEPQLAIRAVMVLCIATTRFPSVCESLLRVARVDGLAGARVLTWGIGFAGLSLKGNFDDLICYILKDFRILVRYRQTAATEGLVSLIPAISPYLSTATIEQTFDLMYLLSEHYLAKERYSQVLNIPQLFSKEWELYLQDKSRLGELARPVELCLARAFEATGQLSKARDLYASHAKQDHVDVLDVCIAGERMYTSIKLSEEIEGIDNMTLASRELPDGNIALFFKQKQGEHSRLKFHVFMTETDSLVERQLPNEGIKWRDILLIPDHPTQSLRILVSSKASTSESDSIEDLLSSMSLGPRDSNQPAEPVELWEFHDNIWHQIKTRGCIPDRFVVTRIGRGCSILLNNLIIFGGMDMLGSIGRSRTSNESSVGAFMLDFKSREWFRIPHPYTCRTCTNPTPDMMGATLPVYTTVWTTEIDGQLMIAMLRQEKSEVNSKRGNEVVPKYTLDLLGVCHGTDRPENFWILDVAISDRCGYLASAMHCTCMQVGTTCLVLGSSTGVVKTLQTDGATKMNFEKRSLLASMCALDLTNREWRGIDIFNVDLLLKGGETSNHKLVPSSEASYCHVASISSGRVQIHSISNLTSRVISSSFTKPLSARKRLSKKNTLSYQLSRAEKNRVRPLRDCASCRAFEPVGVNFKCCARCRVPFYCSVECQRRHWKQGGHKEQCMH